MSEARSEAAIRARCTRFLSHHGVESPAAALRRLADLASPAEPADAYGVGGAVARLEDRTATLLGKPAARFFIKGVSAQLCALRVHAEAAGNTAVALHPLSHLDHDEANAIERIGGLRAIRLGRWRPFDVAALDAVTERLRVVVVELPLRRAGYLLPSWDELVAISTWCREKGVALHLDGARLWESSAGYGVTVEQIAALADTVYVSFYKGLGGLGGAVLAGSVEHVRALGVWKTRFGGDLVTAYPQALSALAGMDDHLPRMPRYVMRARALAERLQELPGLTVNPPVPHINAFQLILPGCIDNLRQRHLEMAERRKAWLFNALVDAPLVDQTLAEVTVGAAADAWSDDEALTWIKAMLPASPRSRGLS
ncbi:MULTISPECIES: beta-eliminating lyase-related protein [unclassified Sphingomonas]|uniref:threonine aldolase family protein n=1 Tax=unclassified Sphingomonas TaxID=196159 RepID=UPI00226A3585|nr:MULTISPECIES: beta-eliminating lyase-related protein [unclassified Sphingomonas]